MLKIEELLKAYNSKILYVNEHLAKLLLNVDEQVHCSS